VFDWGEYIKEQLEKAEEETTTPLDDDISNQFTCQMLSLWQLSNDLVDENDDDNVMTPSFDPLPRPLDENLVDETPVRTAS
jgi:hypothetical protein